MSGMVEIRASWTPPDPPRTWRPRGGLGRGARSGRRPSPPATRRHVAHPAAASGSPDVTEAPEDATAPEVTVALPAVDLLDGIPRS